MSDVHLRLRRTYAIIQTLTGRFEIWESCEDSVCAGVYHKCIATTDDRYEAQRIVRSLESK